MKNNGQSNIEYFILIAIIVGAFLAMQVYIKRGMQGRIRGYAQQLSAEAVYSPGAASANSVLTKKVSEASRSYAQGPDQQNPGPDDKRYITETEVSIRQGVSRQEEVLPFAAEPRR